MVPAAPCALLSMHGRCKKANLAGLLWQLGLGNTLPHNPHKGSCAARLAAFQWRLRREGQKACTPVWKKWWRWEHRQQPCWCGVPGQGGGVHVAFLGHLQPARAGEQAGGWKGPCPRAHHPHDAPCLHAWLCHAGLTVYAHDKICSWQAVRAAMA